MEKETPPANLLKLQTPPIFDGWAFFLRRFSRRHSVGYNQQRGRSPATVRRRRRHSLRSDRSEYSVAGICGRHQQRGNYMINLFWFLTGTVVGYMLKAVADSNNSKGNIHQRGFAIVEFQNFKLKGVFTEMELKEGYYVDVEAKPKTAAGHDA